MMLDRERLAGYVGSDAAFELEFLRLLHGTVANCLEALSQPTLQIYGTLHAAKAGLSVATTEELRQCIDTACELTANLPESGLTLEVRSALARLDTPLAQLKAEIASILSASEAYKDDRTNSNALE
jgi:hypothetical protein